MISALVRELRKQAIEEEREFDRKYPNAPHRHRLDFKSPMAEALAALLESGISL